jgi:hypothetical protein
LESYVTLLFESELPFGPWVAALVWLALFLANHWTARAVRAANDAQHSLTVEDWAPLRRGFQPKYVAAQVLLAGLLLLLAAQLGGSAYVFFAGGYIVAIAYALALNLQGLLSARALARPGAATGTLTFSTASAFRHTAHRLLGGACASLVTGLVVAHLALLGGTFFLTSMAIGCWRRARNVRAQP